MNRARPNSLVPTRTRKPARSVLAVGAAITILLVGSASATALHGITGLVFGTDGADPPRAGAAEDTLLLDLDHDRDGLSLRIELALGTDPFDPDTDQDGVSDGAETRRHHDPNQPNQHRSDRLDDADRDGLSDGEEDALGTDPENADTDGDGYDDGLEQASGSDPDNNTSRPDDDDQDGLPDTYDDNPGSDPAADGNDDESTPRPTTGDDQPRTNQTDINQTTNSDNDDAASGEAQTPSGGRATATRGAATNPAPVTPGSDCTADIDGDGLTMCEEVAHGTDPLASDTDHDGTPDGYEVAAGRDPLIPSQVTTQGAVDVIAAARGPILRFAGCLCLAGLALTRRPDHGGPAT